MVPTLFSNQEAAIYEVVETDPDNYTSTTLNNVVVNIIGSGVGVANFGDQIEGTVSGTVFNDENANARQDDSEEGIGQVTIQLKDSVGEVTEVISSGDGSYLFTNVEPGQYTLEEIDPDGFVSTTSNIVVVQLTSGSAEAVNFGDIASGTIKGTVFNDFNGTGFQEEGEVSLGGVTVNLMDPNSNEIFRTTETFNNGVYVFTDVTPGIYMIEEIDPDGFVSTTAHRVIVNISTAGAAIVNFGDQSQGTVSGKVFIDSNGDSLQNGNEQGIGSVTVQLGTINSESLTDPFNILTETQTSNDGSYLFSDVEPGNYFVIEIDPDGFNSVTLNTVPISIAEEQGAATANFGDISQGTISGRVFDDLNGNGRQDMSEQGLGGVTISLSKIFQEEGG